MKKAVAYLMPFMEAEKSAGAKTAGTHRDGNGERRRGKNIGSAAM